MLFGASGVDLFFAISGFIMYYTNRDYFGGEGAAARFLVRRIIRIVPLYWLCTFVVVLVHAAGFLANQDITLSSLVASLLFLPNPHIVHGVGWTLNYEMYFYAVFATSLGFAASGIWGVIASIPLFMVLSWSFPESTASGFLGNPIALEFCFGCVVGIAFTRGWMSVQLSRLALVVGCLGLVLGTWFGPSEGTAGVTPHVRFLLWGLPAAAILTAMLSLGLVKNRVGSMLLALGDASYSIYLTHPFLMTTYALVLKRYPPSGVPQPILVLVPILASLALGFATFHLIERPITQWLRFWPKRAAASATVGFPAAR